MIIYDLLWKMDVTGKTKGILLVIALIVIIYCTCYLKRVQPQTDIFKNIKKGKVGLLKPELLIDKPYLTYKKLPFPTLCQQEYIKCIETNATTKINDYYCYTCQKDGKFPESVFNPAANRWFTLDIKTGVIKGSTPYG